MSQQPTDEDLRHAIWAAIDGFVDKVGASDISDFYAEKEMVIDMIVDRIRAAGFVFRIGGIVE